MGNTIAFDTHAYVKKLREAGVDERQAEVQAEALVALVEDRLATKRDIADLKRDFKELDVKLETRSKELDVKLETRSKELDVKLETNLADMRRDFKEMDIKLETRSKELDVKLETNLADMKRDFKEMDGKLETRFKEMDTKLETSLRELELRMILKMGGMILAGIGILFGLMRAWPLPVQFTPIPGQEIRQTIPQSPLSR